jgi:hypothetical protein
MKDTSTYQIDLQNHIEEHELNATSPIHVRVIHVDQSLTRLAVHTDQSGLIGLIRHLHARGLVLLSIHRDRTGNETHTNEHP